MLHHPCQLLIKRIASLFAPMAKQINATTTALPTSHVPMLSRPKDVAAVILKACEKVK